MSRCFPYPPPFLEESLIESIKAKKEEREKAKEVERRRVKKETKKGKRREEKRENVEQKSATSQYEGKSKHEEKSPSEQKDLYSQRTSNDAIEQLEGSGLTEEHELLSFTGHKYDSPESSQDSNKRRKLVSSICGHNKHGNILRIKLPLRSASSSRVDLPLQPSLRPPAMQTAGQVVVAKSKEMVHELPEVHEQPSVSGKDAKAAVPSHLSSDVIRRRTGQRGQFEDLIVNWNPPLSQLESLDVSSEWWHFGDPKRLSTPCTNECEAITVGGSSCGERRISLQQPRACYLPEFDAYQLPYVVPF
uniref:Uncharacterized protein n=1 Tax=Musa acuminata subsp. malaccensis TaxID=214687 RepID=A0A804K6H2_MUSAM|nr:PREDICTED: uncharacterized protein LOC103994420 isoform X2 [Musa acuminata subsp. malaccensis]